ncbi:MAG: hypothetical protein ISR85_02080 [Kiritimatiellales bacterium]|nr:hypothetical protein [Kiritimatiellota bacterium]MBL7011703.1 hypothetical protein [Kiritimatiellales bacterium]
MTKNKKIILSISSVLLVLILYGWFFGVQTLCLIGLRFVDRAFLDAVPQPLDLNLSSPAVTTLEASNCSFSVPWTNCVQTDMSGDSAMWTCADSQVYLIYHNSKEMLEPAVDEERLAELHGVMGYAFKSNVFFATSADLSFFDSREDAAKKNYLLICKMISSSGPLTDVYLFEHRDMKGFQEGAFSENSMVSLSVFDQEDWEHTLIVAVPSESELSITQADINTITTTFSVEP